MNLVLSEFKNILYVFYSIIWSTPIRLHHVFCKVLVVLVLIPCFVEGIEVITLKEEPKFVDGCIVFSETDFEHIGDFGKTESLGGLKSSEFRSKGFSQGITSEIKAFISFMFSHDNAAKQCSEQYRESPNEQFFDQIFDLIVLFCILWLGIGLPFYLFYTQRQN